MITNDPRAKTQGTVTRLQDPRTCHMDFTRGTGNMNVQKMDSKQMYQKHIHFQTCFMYTFVRPLFENNIHPTAKTLRLHVTFDH